MMYIDYIDTPLGTLEMQSSPQGLTRVTFPKNIEHEVCTNEIIDNCKVQMQEYFEGTRKGFDLPLDPAGTNFQKSIWNCLVNIPFGQVVSYLYIAKQVNNPKAVRAVGAANGKNPIGIIVPCHRVIGINGTLTGYAGGLERKAWLLEHEGADAHVLDNKKVKKKDDLQAGLFD